MGALPLSRATSPIGSDSGAASSLCWALDIKPSPARTTRPLSFTPKTTASSSSATRSQLTTSSTRTPHRLTETGDPGRVVRDRVAAFDAHDLDHLVASFNADATWVTGSDRFR